tara:strand:+ start:46676 stop:47536 length:861 start_codon:yes stop_codon:yes gene_type:complete
MNKPLVSVCMITYNHENYIKQALEGVLMQQCSFDLELILSNDASTDETDKLIKEILRDTNAISLRYTNHPKNIGMIPNFKYALEQCKGSYIAICEGDDYWTDPLKIQKQIDFLEQHPSFALCFHNVNLYDENLKTIYRDTITRPVSEITNLKDVARGNYIHTPSVVIRNSFILPDWFVNVYLGDWSLYMIAVGSKKIKKFPESMAVYRISDGAAWSTQEKKIRKENSRRTVAIIAEKAELPKKVQKILNLRLSANKSSRINNLTLVKILKRIGKFLYRKLNHKKKF